MLNPISTLSRYASQRGLSDAVYAAKEKALLDALLYPSVDDGSRILAQFAHGDMATRLLESAEDMTVQVWNLGADDWADVKADPKLDDACLFAKKFGGDPLDTADVVARWKWVDDVDEYDQAFDSRLKLAEFFYDQQGVGHPAANHSWGHLTDVASLVFKHNGEVPAGWDEKRREKVLGTLSNLQLAWGEIEPVAKIEVDASPRYLVSITSVSEPLAKLRVNAAHARPFGTKVDREWMSGEQLAETVKQFGIDQAAYPSPSYAEHLWWVSSKPVMQGAIESCFQLDVHELADAHGYREPTAEDFQRIGDIIGVAFDEPMPLRAVVIHHEGMGIYLGNAMGLGFWSKLDPAGQDAAVTFADEAEAKAHMESWEGGISEGAITYPEVEADQANGRYASLEACVRAGLPAWEVEVPSADHVAAGPG